MTANEVKTALGAHARPETVVLLQRFFKTGPGQYGEGDVFIGVKMAPLRQVSKQFTMLPLAEVQKLLSSPVHEHRMAGAIILDYQYTKASDDQKSAIYKLYLKNVRAGRINNWDIVDVTCRDVVGRHICELDLPRDILFTLARSGDLWQKRVSIISTFYFFKYNTPEDIVTQLELCELLLHDPHDLIQKAVGWTLREIGKRFDRRILTEFLDKHAHNMPRTALRYAIEHLPIDQRKHYLALKERSGDN